jgi:predicted RNase H-like nuclease (RuvC/YqgF family)
LIAYFRTEYFDGYCCVDGVRYDYNEVGIELLLSDVAEMASKLQEDNEILASDLANAEEVLQINQDANHDEQEALRDAISGLESENQTLKDEIAQLEAEIEHMSQNEGF